MKKNFLKALVFLLVVSPLVVRAEISAERISYIDVINDASIYLELASFDASSTSGIFNIMITPGSQSINASGVVLSFSTSSVEILGILTGSSFCDFFLENTFNNEIGELSLSGMKPYPGEESTALLGQVIFEMKNNSTTTISIIKERSMVLANNGFASNVLATTTDLKL